jgi:molybdopterin molybdotransferase
VSSNSLALGATITALGGDPLQLGIAPDDRETLRSMFAGAKGADLLLTSGGVSVGEHDLVRSVLGEEGMELDFWQIAMRPGKPLMFGKIGETPVIGLPGNPVSTMVCAMIFIKPAMKAMLGMDISRERLSTATLGSDLGANDERQDYLRAQLYYDDSGNAVATPFSRQDSSMMARLAEADCLVVRLPGAPALKAGHKVEIMPIGGGLVQI